MGTKFGQISKRYEAYLFPKESTPLKINCWKKVPVYFFSKNRWMIPPLLVLILEKNCLPNSIIKNKN